MKLDMKSKKNKANSHRGRGKEVAYPDTSDGQKGTLLSMNVSDISNALKAGGIGKRSTAPENPADWTMRANLIPRSIVGLNRDRAIKYLLTYVLIGVLIVSLVVSVFMFAQSTWADHRVEVAQQKTISLQKEKAQFKDVEDTLNSLDDAQKAKIAMLYDEMDWMKVAGFAEQLASGRRPVYESGTQKLPDRFIEQFVLILRQYVHCVVW